MSFTCVTPQELDRAEQDPEWAWEFLGDLHWAERRPDDPEGWLDRAHAGIQYLLDAAGAGLELQMDGFPLDKEGMLNGWTVDAIRRAAEELRAYPFERLAAHYDPARMAEEQVYPDMWRFDPEGQLEYLRTNYETLVHFFDAAAAAGSAAIMTFTF